MGRPASDSENYLQWKGRLERYQVSDLDLSVFCLQEGVSRSTFYRWKDRLRDGIPESLDLSAASPDYAGPGESVFVPLSLNASPVEIELPNAYAEPMRKWDPQLPSIAGGQGYRLSLPIGPIELDLEAAALCQCMKWQTRIALMKPL